MDVAPMSMLPQKPLCAVQESLLNVNVGLIIPTSFNFFGYLVHDRLIADGFLQRFIRPTKVEEVLKPISFNFFFLFIDLVLLPVYLCLKFGQVVFAVAFVLWHVTHESHKFHLAFELGNAL